CVLREPHSIPTRRSSDLARVVAASTWSCDRAPDGEICALAGLAPGAVSTLRLTVTLDAPDLVDAQRSLPLVVRTWVGEDEPTVVPLPADVVLRSAPAVVEVELDGPATATAAGSEVLLTVRNSGATTHRADRLALDLPAGVVATAPD